MPARMIFFCLTLLEFILAAADHTCFRVTQIPKRAAANRREDITFYCTFSICQQSSKPNVIWWKQVGNERVQIEASGRQQFGFENEATAFLSLLRVDIQDSGHYHCTVNYQGIGQRSGTPSQLFVRVAPVPLKITPKFHEENSLVSLTLLCETAAFYPEDFTLAWYKNGTKTTVGINTSKVQNSEGLYEVSSSLVDPHPPSSNLKYTCEISHISLKTPAVVTHSISTFGGFQKDSINNSLVIWPSVRYVIFSALVVILFVFGTTKYLRISEVKKNAQGNQTAMSMCSPCCYRQ